MVSVRSARSKGATFEYDAHYSLLSALPNAYLTKQRGFQLMYDIQDDNSKSVFECKRLRGISWKQLVCFYEKLRAVAPQGYQCFILFKSNQQPCLVFSVEPNFGNLQITTFLDIFNVPFQKHLPIQRKKVNHDESSERSSEVGFADP